MQVPPSVTAVYLGKAQRSLLEFVIWCFLYTHPPAPEPL